MNNQQPILTRAIAEQIGNDLARLQELSSSPIATPTRDAEIQALESQLAGAFLQYAPDFLSAWFVVKTEYEPIMGGIALMLNRAGQINSQRQALAEAQRKAAVAAAAKASNVVTLETK